MYNFSLTITGTFHFSEYMALLLVLDTDVVDGSSLKSFQKVCFHHIPLKYACLPSYRFKLVYRYMCQFI